MNIYTFHSDFAYKDITGINDDTIGDFYYHQGQPLSDSWNVPVFIKVEDISTLKREIATEKKKKDDFDARSYGNIFLIRKNFSSIFKTLPVELLPVKTEGIIDEFVYVNVLSVIKAIDFDGLDFEQSMAMLSSHAINFIAKEVENQIIFRDIKLNNTYYCTDKFLKIMEENRIRGLNFEKVGEVK